MFKLKSIIFAAVFLFSISAKTETLVEGSATKINYIITYNVESVSGDIMFKVDNPTNGCEAGFFIEKENAGLTNSLSVALSAFHSGSNVKVWAYSGVEWDATSRTDYCRVHGIAIVK